MAIRRLALALTAALAIGSVFLHGQTPGQNINMVTGKAFPGGDPWLQKQNEPSGAVSTKNPCRLLGGANDYRAVNVPGLPGDKEIGDAWVGWYTSVDCGQTWYSTLMPGYLQDQTAIGKASPVYGLTTAADPTVRAGAGGFFAYSFIAYNRGSNIGKVAVARFLDRNTNESIKQPESAISYIDTKAWDNGSAGNYIDKPTLTVTQGAGTCSVTTAAGKTATIPASTVHLAWTVFVGNSDDVIRTKVYYARSSNCGASLDGPATKLSEGYAITQSASVAVAPNGAIYVVWRQFASSKGDPNQILVAKSVDGGKSFTKGTPIPMPQAFLPVDQGTSSKTFRMNSFPSTATDQWGRLYVAVAARGFANAGQSRVVVMSTMDGLNWNSPPMAIDNDANAPGHQIMPALTSVGGKLNAVWVDFHDDVASKFGYGLFDFFIKEIYPFRHTMDVRGAQATLQQNGTLTWTKYGILQDASPEATAPRISRYLVGDYEDPNGDTHLKYLQFNRAILKLYAGGTRPFIGDVIDVAGLAYLAQQNGLTTTWLPNDGTNAALDTTAARTFYAFWTDNRDAKVGTFPAEPDSDTQEGAALPYMAPGTAACSGTNPPTKTRNANVYMSQITPDVFVAAPTNSKPSIKNNNPADRIQRTFPVLVRNNTGQQRTFTMTIVPPANLPSDSRVTFQQVPFEAYSTPPTIPLPPAVLSTDVIIPPKSSITRTVFVVSSIKYPQIRVNVTESAVVVGSTIINADIENADIENADIENADIENQELHNADIENADIENADIENADIENADIENADIENADIENADIENADIENADIENADIENADIENADIENGSLTDFSMDLDNQGNTTTSYQVKASVFGQTSPYLFQLIGRRVYKTPTAVGCTLTEAGQNQVLFNITNPNITPGTLPNPLDPSITNATVLVAPGEHIKITLRIWDKDVLTGPGAPPNDGIQPFCPMLSDTCQTVTSTVTITATSQSANTGSNTPPSTTASSTGVVPGTATVTNTSDSGPGSLRQAIVDTNAQAGGGFISFAIPGAGVHTIAPTSPLPQLTKPIVIDATTQAGYAGSPLIELDGTNAGATAGLVLASDGSVVRGLAINRFNGNGITVLSSNNEISSNYIGTDAAGTQDLGNAGSGLQIIDGANNFVGGTAVGARNLISGNNGEGVRIDGAPSTANIVRGNYIGISASGMADLGNNNSGVYLRKAPGNSVIQNLISGNDGFAGVAICGGAACGGGPAGTQTSNASGNIIQSNLIGTNALGTGALGNAQLGVAGVSIDGAPNTVVGGPLAVDRNVLSANYGAGVLIFNAGADNNLIRGNYIGTDINGAPLGNSGNGVQISAGTGNIVSGKEDDRTAPNVIKFNAGAGIYVGAGQHEFRINQIDANGGLGVTGGENLGNGPNLTSATVNGGVVTVAGTLFGAPGQHTIDLYKSPACDSSGYGEGAQWFGAFVVTVPSEGPASFNIGFGGDVVAAGQLVTALATTGDQITNPGTTGATTQFSNCQMAVPPGFKFSTPSAGGNGHVYEYVQTPGTWTAAKAAAAARTFRGVNGHLATITSGFENSLVGSFRGATNDLRGWIGLTDEVTEGTFQWITGEPVTYTAWNGGEPNNQLGTEDYVEIFAAALWNDISNSGDGFNQGYVVEYDVNPFQGVVTDFAADAGGGPDLIWAEAINTGINLIVHVRLTPGTFSSSSTLVQLLLDTDRNPATGHPGVNAGCTSDAGVIGSEYLVNMLNSSASIYQYAGTCNQFTLTSTISATATSDGYDVVIPLASIGGDDGVVNFKFATSTQLSPGVFTGVQDVMSDPGLPPGTTVIGGS